MSVLKDCYIVNAVGKESVDLLVKNKMIDKENIKIISGVPCAQCVVER